MNTTRYTAVLAHLKRNPSHLDQKRHTGIPCCVAANTVLLFGSEQAREAVRSANPMVGTLESAQHLLELTDAQADWLFDADRTWSELVRFAETNGDYP